VTATDATGALAVRDGSWRRRQHQLSAVISLELPRTLRGRRALPLFALGVAPVAVLALAGVARFAFGTAMGVVEIESHFADLYRGLVVRWCVFFACAAVFTNLVRGDMAGRTLHYYLLAPLRREVLLLGKFAAGLAGTGLVMGAGTCLAYAVAFATLAERPAVGILLHGPGLAHLLSYAGITLLACAGYGAVFTLLGVLFRNPILPVLAVLGWEYVNFLLPPGLKEVSVAFYLNSLAPVPVSEGLVAIAAEPASPPVAVGGLLLLAALLVALAAARMRRIEIRYETD
jgi:hypothetical protein